MKKLTLVARVLCAAILVQTLFFKFTAAPESVYIFTKIGIEPWGRWASGIAELIAAILLLVPATAGIGALFVVPVMFGAIASHLTILGVVVQDDGGLLFGLACTVLLGGLFVLWNERNQILGVAQLLRSKR